jgi:hypothetical protein
MKDAAQSGASAWLRHGDHGKGGWTTGPRAQGDRQGAIKAHGRATRATLRMAEGKGSRADMERADADKGRTTKRMRRVWSMGP